MMLFGSDATLPALLRDLAAHVDERDLHKGLMSSHPFPGSNDKPLRITRDQLLLR